MHPRSSVLCLTRVTHRFKFGADWQVVRRLKPCLYRTSQAQTRRVLQVRTGVLDITSALR
jgi:hypothetical protein